MATSSKRKFLAALEAVTKYWFPACQSNIICYICDSMNHHSNYANTPQP